MYKSYKQHIIRSAKISDWFSIYSLMHGFFTNLSHAMLSYYIYYSTYNKNLLVLTENKRVIGMVGCSCHKNDIAYVDYLVITPVKRGNGLAVGLLDEICKHCAEYKVKKLLLTVKKKDVLAFKFYIKYGFKSESSTTEKFVLSKNISSFSLKYRDYYSLEPSLLTKIIFKSIFYVIGWFCYTKKIISCVSI